MKPEWRVRIATDLRERKREQDALQKAYDELEKQVEERTAELEEARGEYSSCSRQRAAYVHQSSHGQL
jgi:nitrate/nitrite-specific signal transduction histidine kinase